MTFNDLRYIVVIAEENSITKAADKLYMTQPALSQYLKKVEKELGVLIFERTTTGVPPRRRGCSSSPLPKTCSTRSRT